MRKYGRKTLDWDRIRKELKQEFLENGITTCELRYENCQKNDYLSWAHGKKRRHLIEDELKSLIILACQNCHTIIERLPESEMCAIVELTIEKRNQMLAKRKPQ